MLLLRCQKGKGKTTHQRNSRAEHDPIRAVFCFRLMDNNTATVKREGIALAKFGGRTWELAGVEYNTVILRDRYAEIRVHRDRIETVNREAEEMLIHGESVREEVL